MIKEATKWIWVTFQRAGFHYYPEAGTNPNLKDVSYLSFKHRHLFKFKIQIQVTHSNRELEFHQVLNFCESLFDDRIINIDNKSVEMLADSIYDSLSRAYPSRAMKIEVSEDGECGGVIEYFPENS
jgi:hypothetical protein